MSAKNEYSDSPTLFEATISIDLEGRQRLETLDIDVLPEPERVKDDRFTIRALVQLDQIEALVGAGAEVTLRRAIDPEMPAAYIRHENKDEVAERLRSLEQFREDRPEGAD